MKKILCLTDFSDNAYNGILYANELAKKFSTKLVFMHTYELLDKAEPEVISNPSLVAYTDTESRDKLYKLCLELQREDKYSAVSYEYFIKEGDVSKSLNAIIKERNIDLIVFSSEGKLKPEDKFYGNFVSEIIEVVECPIFVVPTNVSYKNIENIIYLFDDERDDMVVYKAISFAKLFIAQLNCVVYVKDKNSNTEMAVASKFDLIKKLLDYEKVNFEIRKIADKSEILSSFNIETNSDVLIVNVSKPVLEESITSNDHSFGFIFRSKIPLLIIPDSTNY